jgi:hypothetical protein
MRIDGTPTSIGSKTLGMISRFGLASYAAGGFEVEAVEFGLKEIDVAGGMDSDNGVYFVGVRIDAPSEDKSPRTSVWVQVFDATTGAEVADSTNLSAVTFRLWAIG